jgi:hypothetical protein
MTEPPAPHPALLARPRWATALVLALALLWVVAPAAHAGTHLATHPGMHLASPTGNNQGCNGNNNQGGNGNNNQCGNGANQGDGTATPELPSGILFGLALVPAALVMLWRRRALNGTAR